MYGQMTAGSWIYIGSQGIVQGTYETFVEMGRQHYDGDLTGKWILTAGPRRHGRRAAAGRVARRRVHPQHRMPADRASTCACARATSTSRRPTSTTRSRASRKYTEGRRRRNPSRCSATPPRSCPSSSAAACVPTPSPTRPARTIRCTATCRSAGRVEQWLDRAEERTRSTCATRPRNRCACTSRRCSRSRRMGIPTFDYGNNIRQMAFDEGCENAFDFPGFVPAYVRPLFCRGIGPFRWVALSPAIPRTSTRPTPRSRNSSPTTSTCTAGSTWRSERISFQGLPARICWVGLGLRDKLGLAFNEMVRNGELKAPIVIGRDHLDSGSRRLTQPRNRSDEGRQRRRQRLAAAQRDAERRRRRDLGVAAPRRRRRHGLLAALAAW